MPYLASSQSADKQLRNRFDQARAEALTPLSHDEVSSLVHQILTSLGGDISAADLTLYKELEELARYIHHAKAELDALRPHEIRENHIPSATDELDAVIGATEAATNIIMDACDAITAVAGTVAPEHGNMLIEQVTRVFEACNFQDVTGQRITKVVRTLKTIESRVDALILAFGEQVGSSVAVAPEPATDDWGDPDAGLLHGPALPGQAIDQDEIDRLLASFD
ncbi:MAG: protein phosphatase CheZ [Rhodospirillaceae bacterium]